MVKLTIFLPARKCGIGTVFENLSNQQSAVSIQPRNEVATPETYAKLGSPGVKWDEPGGGRRIAGIAVIARNRRNRKAKAFTAEGGGATWVIWRPRSSGD